MKPKRRSKAKKATPEEAQERYALVEKASGEFEGNLDELESAIGMYVIGHDLGWKVLHVIHSKKTIAKYERILGIKVTEVFPEFGPDAERTNAFRIIQGINNFWKFVSGEEKVDIDRETRRAIR